MAKVLIDPRKTRNTCVQEQESAGTAPLPADALPGVSATPALYRIFDLALQSDLALPELPRTLGNHADLRFSLQTASADDSKEVAWSHQWKDPRGNTAISAGQTDDGYLLRFPSLADFHLDSTCTSIRCRPRSTTSAATIRHLLLDQVIPRAVAHRGDLVLHASAVLLPPGCACFVGPSGAGKSTLASSFEAAGYRLLTDDAILLRMSPRGITCIPSYEGARLWPSALERLQLPAMSRHPVAEYTEKTRLIPSSMGVTRPKPELTLTAFFIIPPPRQDEMPREGYVEPISGTRYFVELLKQAFVLDARNRLRAAEHFKLLGRIAQADKRMYRLIYRRDFDQLEQVRARVLETVLSQP